MVKRKPAAFALGATQITALMLEKTRQTDRQTDRQTERQQAVALRFPHTDFNEDTTNESASVACSNIRL